MSISEIFEYSQKCVRLYRAGNAFAPVYIILCGRLFLMNKSLHAIFHYNW